MRLIDADALIDKYGDWYTEEGTEEGYIGTVKGIVDSMPTIDPQLDEWCESCKEYDQTTHSCPRFNHVIRTTLDDVRKEAYKHGKSKGIKKGIAMSHKSGVWMYERDAAGFGKCSVCGSLWDSSLTQNCFFKYCPRCGAEMVDDVIKF